MVSAWFLGRSSEPPIPTSYRSGGGLYKLPSGNVDSVVRAMSV